MTTIDCDTCTVRGLACGDCVVTVLLGSAPPVEAGAPIELDNREQAAIAVLAGAGLVPPLRLVKADESAPAEGQEGDGPAAAGARSA
ncbi:hypothetical protein ACIB24_20680 [Spongisporangium articulatum]|uniref:Uncharacterized protein n=1 Tax=Spongisporangium articulatum TaxID=3362603 RepID=A0ABW8ATS1_9ACTN